MNTSYIFLGVVMLTIGILTTVTQVKALKAGKHETGDFIVRLLISGIGCIICGLTLIIKYL